MNKLCDMMINKAKELLLGGEINRVIAWKKGELCYEVEPYVFSSAEELGDMVYDGFCGANLAKYLILESKKEGKVAVFMKPCDVQAYDRLKKEHRVNPDNVLVIGIECDGMLDHYKFKDAGVKAPLTASTEDEKVVNFTTLYGDKSVDKAEVLLEKCLTCKTREVLTEEKLTTRDVALVLPTHDRYAEIEKLENATEEERFAFWQSQLSKCIRCNACRNVCPACTCINCVFDNNKSGVATKAPADSFEEQMFHIIRAFHVAGRCVDCGECSRVCPERIPLHLLNRKFIKDINTLYGEYEPGAVGEEKDPLVRYTEQDSDPGKEA